MLEKLKDLLSKKPKQSKKGKEGLLQGLWKEKARLILTAFFEYSEYRELFYTVAENKDNNIDYPDIFAQIKVVLSEDKKSYNNFDDYLDKWLFFYSHLDEREHEKFLKDAFGGRLDDDLQIEIFDSFLSPDYMPPIDPNIFWEHFHSLVLYYCFLACNISEIPITTGLLIDNAAIKIIRQEKFMESAIDRISRNLKRGQRGSTTKGYSREIRKKLILKAYRKLSDNRRRDHTIATEIKNRWQELTHRMEPAPCINTIKGALHKLRKEGEIPSRFRG